jgi:group I intron endonuclease
MGGGCMNIIGIYGILNKINKKIYIGASKNIVRRWKCQKYNLSNNIHINKSLQNEWNTFGENCFDFFIIEELEFKSSLQDREDFFIKQHSSHDSNFGYNVQKKPSVTKDANKEIAVCEICGCSENEVPYFTTKNNKFKMVLCGKHYGQLKYSGKITDDSKPKQRNINTPNEIVTHDDFAEILCYDKRGEYKNSILIDIEDIDFCKNYKWGINTINYASTTIDGKTISMHRLLMNPTKDLVVDHINGNTLDNTRKNLRICTKQQNNRNRHENRVIGVVMDKKRNKWKAIITVNDRQVYLGRFNNFEDAVLARRQAEQKYYGEFAPQPITITI